MAPRFAFVRERVRAKQGNQPHIFLYTPPLNANYL